MSAPIKFVRQAGPLVRFLAPRSRLASHYRPQPSSAV